VYHLSDTANASIPEDIRKEFQRDDQGHVLFFTTPPLDVLPPAKRGSPIGHTAAYLAAKIRRRLGLKEGEMPDAAPVPGSSEEPASKKAKHSHDAAASTFAEQVIKTRNQALEILIAQMEQGTEAIYKHLYGEHWAAGMDYEMEKLAVAQGERQKLNDELKESERKRKEKDMISLRGTGVYLDDIDPRY
jgi:chromatin structure-remodeling complex subunit RSC1/2